MQLAEYDMVFTTVETMMRDSPIKRVYTTPLFQYAFTLYVSGCFITLHYITLHYIRIFPAVQLGGPSFCFVPPVTSILAALVPTVFPNLSGCASDKSQAVRQCHL